MHSIEKLNAKERYALSISFKKNTAPTSLKYFEKCFSNLFFKWKNIYNLSRSVTVNTELSVFQYEILNNVYILTNIF